LASIRASKASAASPRSRKIAPITLATSAAPLIQETKKRGRPKTDGKKPWEEAGVSKATFYRQQKAKDKTP
jgi:hypothetical protein